MRATTGISETEAKDIPARDREAPHRVIFPAIVENLCPRSYETK